MTESKKYEMTLSEAQQSCLADILVDHLTGYSLRVRHQEICIQEHSNDADDHWKDWWTKKLARTRALGAFARTLLSDIDKDAADSFPDVPLSD